MHREKSSARGLMARQPNPCGILLSTIYNGEQAYPDVWAEPWSDLLAAMERRQSISHSIGAIPLTPAHPPLTCVL